MKKLIVILPLLFPLLIFSQYIPDTIYSQVNGSYVKIFDDGAMRVCGTEYEHIVVSEDSTNLIWYQEWVSGMPVYCICNYDYMVEIGPLDAGVYTMDVYYESSQYHYIGTTTFEILSPTRTDTLQIIDSYSSDCYFVGQINSRQGSPIKIIDQKSKRTVLFQSNSNENTHIQVLTLEGRIVFENESNGSHEVNWEYLSQSTGIYIYKIKSNSYQYSGKLMIAN